MIDTAPREAIELAKTATDAFADALDFFERARGEYVGLIEGLIAENTRLQRELDYHTAYESRRSVA